MTSIHRSNAVATHVASSLTDDASPRGVACRDWRKGGGMSPSVVEPKDGQVVVMSGAVNPGMVIALYRTIAAEVDAGHRGIVIDLSAVTFLGAQTAGPFYGALRLLERRGAAVEILGDPPPFQRMLVAGGGSPRVTQRAERDQQRSLEVIAAFGDHLSMRRWVTRHRQSRGDCSPGVGDRDRGVHGAQPAEDRFGDRADHRHRVARFGCAGRRPGVRNRGSGCRCSIAQSGLQQGLGEPGPEVKQDMQLGKERAQQQAETAKNKAQDGDALAAAIRR